MPKIDYVVLRPHEGDRLYAQHEIRTADPATVKHLVNLGVLREADDADREDALTDDQVALKQLQESFDALNISQNSALGQVDALTAELAAARDELMTADSEAAKMRGDLHEQLSLANEQLANARAEIERLQVAAALEGADGAKAAAALDNKRELPLANKAGVKADKA